MKPSTLAAVIVLIALGVSAVIFWPSMEDYVTTSIDDIVKAPAVEETEETIELPPVEEPVVRYPVPIPSIEEEIESDIQTEQETLTIEEEEIPLEPQAQQEQPIDIQIKGLFDQRRFAEFFYVDVIVHRFVVTVDNLTAKKLPAKYPLAKPLGGKFLTYKDPIENEFIDPMNDRRYQRFIQFVEAIDIPELVGFYFRNYRVFQQAYEDLGYPDRYFNDRLVEVIDHLLQTPNVQGQIALIRPSVFYKYEDPNLERLSAGQKTIIRMGADNAMRVKGILRELRYELTSVNQDE